MILQAPLLEAANFNETPNPSKAPWYFLGLQELLSYFDPQVAGVLVPTFGLIGLMAIPYFDRNPSTKPSDRKFAILMFTFFLAGATTLTIIGVLFRGQGFNFSYPWSDGIFFDDLSRTGSRSNDDPPAAAARYRRGVHRSRRRRLRHRSHGAGPRMPSRHGDVP